VWFVNADAFDSLCNDCVAAAAVVADVADRDQMKNLVSKIAAPLARQTLKARRSTNTANMDDVTHGWDQTLALNLTAPFFPTSHGPA
jgi:gluconate 5-dehydrogenase